MLLQLLLFCTQAEGRLPYENPTSEAKTPCLLIPVPSTITMVQINQVHISLSKTRGRYIDQ